MKVVIIGLGYVGLPIAVRAAEAGHQVVGVDVSPDLVKRLSRCESHVEDVSNSRLGVALSYGLSVRDAATERLESGFDIALITVPTPVDEYKRPDLSYITSATEWLAERMRGDGTETVVLESTTYPGTTEGVVAPIIDQAVGEGTYLLGYSPERINPGDVVHTFESTPKIVSGVGGQALSVVSDFYKTLVKDVVPVSNPKAAELAKVFENTFAQVNIALANELAMVCSEAGLDVDEVLDAAATKGHAFMRFRPGPGVGGHCIAVDPLYLTWMRRQTHGHGFEFADLADKINSSMPEWVVKRCREILRAQDKKLHEAKVLVLGAAYKPDVADIRESPALRVIELLEDHGASVTKVDPHVFGDMPSDAAEFADKVDLVIVTTNHTSFPYAEIQRRAVAVLDTRNVYPQGTDKVFKL
jgi:UDP-N-acetyl-D-glucosamine dehydrogenase